MLENIIKQKKEEVKTLVLLGRAAFRETFI